MTRRMTSRDRFRAIMSFEEPDRVPLWDLEGICEETIRRWCSQGFPPGRNVQEFMGFDGNIFVPLSLGPVPSFVGRTLSSDSEWTTYTDEYGFTVRRLKAQAISPTIYYYIGAAVHNREDWRRIAKRYDPADIRRLPLSWSEELVEHYRTAGSPIGLSLQWGPGRGPKNGYMLGLDPFLEALYDDPGLVEEMFEFWADFLVELCRPVAESVNIDYVVMVEDGLAYKNSTLVGPDIYRRFWAPHVRKVIEFFRGHGVPVFSFYTSGNIDPLMPVLLDTGFNLFGPLEVAAGMDARRLRRQYGRDVLLYGNIGRQALMDGPDAVREEVLEKVPALVESGGYIPAVDDMILPDISFESYMTYVETIRALQAEA